MTHSVQLAHLLASRDFWRDYYSGASFSAPSGSNAEPQAIDWSLPGGFGLRLQLPADDEPRVLTLKSPAIDGFGLSEGEFILDSGGPHSVALRWLEVDFVCRWMSATYVDSPYPGLAMLLLAKLAPILQGSNATWEMALMRRGWELLGVYQPHEIESFLDQKDFREHPTHWQLASGMGWILEGVGGIVTTPRRASNSAFPFTRLNTCIERIERALLELSAAMLGRADAPIRKLALSQLKSLDPELWPILADALEDGGTRHLGVLSAFRPPVDPVRALTMFETLLLAEGIKPGELLRRFLPAPQPGESQRVRVVLPLTPRDRIDHHTFQIAENLRDTLFYVGQGRVLGTSHSGPEFHIEILLRGPLFLALETLRTFLAGFANTRKWSRRPIRVEYTADFVQHQTVWPEWFRE